MEYTLAFDVYGTLIDTSSVFHTLEKLIGDKAEVFSDTWRNKQLEYSFRRSAMKAYVDFSIVTKAALDFTCQRHDVSLSDSQKMALMGEYKVLPSFPECAEAIRTIKSAGHRVYAFSNGSNKAIHQLLSNANILDLFNGYVSLEDISTFKPNPEAYEYFNKKTNSKKEDSWLVSGNSFDVLGAGNYGMKTAWVQRNEKNIIDPWELQPTKIVKNLSDIFSCLT